MPIRSRPSPYSPYLLASVKLLPLFAAAAGSLLAFATAATADTTNAFCRLSLHDHTMVPRSGPCNVSQRQGDVRAYMNTGDEFLFRARDRGHTYTRNNTEKGIIFRVPEAFTLQILWQEPNGQSYTL